MLVRSIEMPETLAIHLESGRNEGLATAWMIAAASSPAIIAVTWESDHRIGRARTSMVRAWTGRKPLSSRDNVAWFTPIVVRTLEANTGSLGCVGG